MIKLGLAVVNPIQRYKEEKDRDDDELGCSMLIIKVEPQHQSGRLSYLNYF